MYNKVKIAIIGAGSTSFCPATIIDILHTEGFKKLPLAITLMDISEDALMASKQFTEKVAALIKHGVQISATTFLNEALEGADFVITAIEKNRYYYWSMDFHIPRRYGFRQIFGENGGPGGMFHALRNMGPMLEIARAMEQLCPDAYLLNYSNPEAKLVEAVSKLTKVKALGLCHGEGMGLDQLSVLLDLFKQDIDADVCGLNHFGWFTRIQHKRTGEDLYPLLRERESKAEWLAHWDELGLSRLMFRTFGLYPYPGANHIGEYIAWGDEMLASAMIQYAYDPVKNDPWNGGAVPEFIYSFSSNPTNRMLFPEEKADSAEPGYLKSFAINSDNLRGSNEYGIPIAEAIATDKPYRVGAVNMLNKGYAPNLKPNMAIEIPALVNGKGIHPIKQPALPEAIAQMINTQGAIHQLLIEAYTEQSRNKLLQATLLDPTISNYNNAVALINEMCERQRDILPPMRW